MKMRILIIVCNYLRVSSVILEIKLESAGGLQANYEAMACINAKSLNVLKQENG